MRFPIVERNIRSLIREKTFLLFIGLLVFMALSMSVLLATSLLIYNPELLLQEQIKVGVVNGEMIGLSLGNERRATLSHYVDADKAQADFYAGDIDSLIIVDDANYPYIAHVILPEDPSTRAVLTSILRPALEDAEARLQQERGALPGAVWHTQARSTARALKGTDVLFEVLLGFFIPLLLLVPAFVLGNMFVDMVTQEFEEGSVGVLFTAVSPLRYVHEHYVQAILTNTVFVGALVGMIYWRFPFVSSWWAVVLFALLFCAGVVSYALWCALVFKKKDTAQLIYSFGIISVFVLFSFTPFSPLFALSEMLLGNPLGGLGGVVGCLGVMGVFYGLIRLQLRREYY